jgi:hypothetical protein
MYNLRQNLFGEIADARSQKKDLSAGTTSVSAFVPPELYPLVSDSATTELVLDLEQRGLRVLTSFLSNDFHLRVRVTESFSQPFVMLDWPNSGLSLGSHCRRASQKCDCELSTVISTDGIYTFLIPAQACFQDHSAECEKAHVTTLRTEIPHFEQEACSQLQKQLTKPKRP